VNLRFEFFVVLRIGNAETFMCGYEFESELLIEMAKGILN
jgi:hypothetical protein